MPEPARVPPHSKHLPTIGMAAAVLAALVIIVASGAVQGFWTGRWSVSRDLERRVAELKNVPQKIGDWEGTENPLDPRVLREAGIAGSVSRHYRNRRTGDAVSLLLVCGRPGPISVHTPEICFRGTGFEPSGETKRVSAGSGSSSVDDLWAAEFTKPGTVLPQRLRILYSWNANGTWKASQNPRWDFGGFPALYKLYVVQELPAGVRDQSSEEDLGLDFVHALLPLLSKTLFSKTT